MFWIVVFVCLTSSSALTVYRNAKFEPSSIHRMLNNFTQVQSQMNCACLCFYDEKCLIASYFGLRQHCILYLATLNDGNLRLENMDEMAAVLIFENKTLPAPSKLTSMNETIFAVWNTSAGLNSSSSSAGPSTGNYYPTHIPKNAFDGNTNTKHLNFGSCNESYNASAEYCGENTGLYLSPIRGISLLLAFRFCTPNSYVERDPTLVTFEGSNEPSYKLTDGSSWTLMYNGTSGLDTVSNRFTCGDMQWLTNNSVWYTSYRMLVSKKRGSGVFVQYSELELFGY